VGGMAWKKGKTVRREAKTDGGCKPTHKVLRRQNGKRTINAGEQTREKSNVGKRYGANC